MATIIKEAVVDAPVDDVWKALLEFGAVHVRLASGFVDQCELEAGGTVRRLTFFNGAVAREALVGVDHRARRLAYTVVEGGLPASHHHASAQAVPADGGRTRFVWITDVLPDSLAETLDQLMERGLEAITRTLEGAGAQSLPSGA